MAEEERVRQFACSISSNSNKSAEGEERLQNQPRERETVHQCSKQLILFHLNIKTIVVYFYLVLVSSLVELCSPLKRTPLLSRMNDSREGTMEKDGQIVAPS